MLAEHQHGHGSGTLLSVRGVGKTYRDDRGGEVRAVHDVSFTLQAGATLGLVGESGSGKSTLSRLIMRLEQPTAGTIAVDGRDIWRMSKPQLRRLRRDVQFVSQNPVASLNPRRTVAEIIAAPLQVHREGGQADRRRRVAELLDLVGLHPDHASRRPGGMSGGQCQRVSIARALALSPRLIVLDEPVTAVDVSIRAQILNLLRDLQRITGVAYLFISHDLSIVRLMAPRLLVMQRGRVVEAAGRDEIFARPAHAYTRSLLAAIPEPDPRRPFPMRDSLAASEERA